MLGTVLVLGPTRTAGVFVLRLVPAVLTVYGVKPITYTAVMLQVLGHTKTVLMLLSAGWRLRKP